MSGSHLSCGVCSTKLGTDTSLHDHEKTTWHIYNQKRQIAALPPVSRLTFEKRIQGSQEDYQSYDVDQRQEGSDSSSSDDEGETKGTESTTGDSSSFCPFNCLFCPISSPTFLHNITHMQESHGLFIPDQEHLIDLEVLVGFLFKLINTFYECLSCGRTKRSPEAAKAHMLSKGHCRINSEDSDLEDFYEFSSSDGEGEEREGNSSVKAKRGKGDDIESSRQGMLELQLRSGKKVTHRSKARQSSNAHRKLLTSSPYDADHNASGTPESSLNSESNQEQQPTSSRQLAVRKYGGMAMIGVTDLQKRTLMALEKKMIKMELRAKNQYQARVEKSANRQKHFKNDVPGPSNG
ncbi:hypothetical protein B7463_g10563, partial [Scytalidium lignicola]